MYQAIVFLPLLGAILAAIIALGGARARFPGHAPPPGLADNETAHAAHGHEPSVGGDAGVIHHSHTEGDGHGHAVEPAAAGSRTAELITTTLLMISMILSWIAFVQVGFGHGETRVPIMSWIVSGDLKIDWALRIDTLTAVMLVVVNSVSAFVHLYSIGYMHEDPYRPRFFA
jgi:NADH-quinone oxidoreductase subunit L